MYYISDCRVVKEIATISVSLWESLFAMNYKDVLKECRDPAVSSAIADALDQLFQHCGHQLRIDVGERALAGRLAEYIRPHFKDHDVEIEYNRMGDAPKKLAWDENLERVYPDIIVHRPMTNEQNLLVIELKKSSSHQPKENDIKKLAAFRNDLEYQYALFLRLGVGDQAGTITECEWV